MASPFPTLSTRVARDPCRFTSSWVAHCGAQIDDSTSIPISTRIVVRRIVKPPCCCTIIPAGIITSDPLTQFAVVSNGRISTKDHALLAARYKGKSVAPSKNSVYWAWTILLSSDYDRLRSPPFSPRKTEMRRFRSLLVKFDYCD
jgi:hypothetical protein